MAKYQLDSSVPVAVIGAGTMGAGVAQVAAQAGHSVRMFDSLPGAAEQALARIGKDLGGAVERGKMTAEERDAVLARLSPTDSSEALAGCGLAVEAIVEQLEPKQLLFKQLEALLGPDAVLATNTSSISITAIAEPLVNPERVIGWHFFNPATRMKLVEVIPGVATDPELIPALHALSRAWGKTSVDAPNTPGFIVNRVARPYYAEGLRLLAERIAPAAAIDRLLREAGGFALGPFELMDLIGVEVNLSVTSSVWEATAYDPRFAPSVIQQELARAGRFGRKSGLGFHDYRESAEPAAVELVQPAPHLPVMTCSALGPKLGLLGELVGRLLGAGVPMTPDQNLPRESMELGNVVIALTDGRTAAQRSIEDAMDYILLDLAGDFTTTKTLGAAASPQAEHALRGLAAAFKQAEIDLVRLDDVAGLVVMRTVCCLANEACDLMTWAGVASADIDTGMKLATAYPRGPLEWADELSASRVWHILGHLQAHYGDDRYRRSPGLSRAHFTGANSVDEDANAQEIAERTAAAMFAGDKASQVLGMQVTHVAVGQATVTMAIRADMLNGFGICHGGLIAALADSAFAFACNSAGELTVASGIVMDYIAPAREGDLLTATAHEVSRTNRTGVYDVEVANQTGAQVAVFRGRSFTVKGKPSVPER